MLSFKRKPKPPRESDFLPGDLVSISLPGETYFAEFHNRHGVITYGPDIDNGWIVSSAPGSLRCVAEELTMITPREDRS